MPLFVIIFVFSSFVFVKFLLNRMNTCIEENGEISMEAVVEQIQQTYDMQVSGYYRQLHFVEGYLCKEKKISLETDNNRNFFKAWEKESESTLLFLQENGKAITSDGTKLKVDMPSKLLLDLRNGSNIGKLVALEFEQVKKDGYLVAIPCQEYTINGETYTAIGTVYDHSKLDSMLNLGGYDGSAYLFMLDDDGNITYTNQKDDIFFRNYSLLKHLKSNHAITEKEFDSLNKKIAEGKKGVELLGKDKPYYLGYCPIESNNTMLICIVKKATVDNVLKEYQKTIGLTTMLMTGFIILLFAGLFYSISRFSIANQKVKFEKRTIVELKKMDYANKIILADEEKTIDEIQTKIPLELNNQYNIVRSTPYFLEFLPNHVSKGNAIIILAQILNIDTDEIMVIGDEENDLSMFCCAKIKVAMKNANLQIKKRANFITESNNNSGVARAIEKFVFK